MTTATIENLSEETLNEIKELIGDDYQEAADNMVNSDNDFTVGDYRFIHQDAIIDILADELASDAYTLGCFKAEFIADVTNWPLVLVEAAQKGEQFEAIGQAIIDADLVVDLASEYASVDGFGHHFATYDGNEHEIENYLVFRIN
jgi:hypothetical protein